ncbi:hypothetical protein SARC_04429 [Sphaeroforma arctica JP610]|uniref:Cation efflux protein transmembrane domain-containing protein n=1 Tax=Sphaeroforma arctica JP610 TaxID=667725 RepID=A0A0L0G364_9EUKA|nr:hypothetical protein SARC_04429 [Sphaeroforma arctica JP610]KNC83304.1 hypothetical protein SARC_04429 [Sphaeroforma arctica JP610]|eukprot:XP_014157206.1 hypothetical protein SARC_04429 [Sphaeroforma arctica JP610]
MSLRTLFQTLNDPKAKTIAALSVLMLIGYSSLLVHAWNTNNQAMVGFLLLDFFNASCLMSEIIVIWVGNQVATFSYSFGFNQVNIVACFSICVLMLLMVFWNCVECMEHLLLPEHHGATHEPSLVVLVCAFVGRFGGLAIVKKYSTGHDSTPETTGGKLKHGLAAMIHATLGSGRVHRAVLLSRSVNSNALISLVSWAIVLLSSMLAPEADYSWVDPITSATVSVLSLGSVLPIMMNHARVLLQTVPANSSLWFKCLREVSNYDGVLEIKNQHLWLNGYKERVASLHVRIRRDANEQVVLAQLSTAFAHLCDSITIQIKKDDWGTGGSGYASTAGANSNFGYGYNTAGASHQPTDLNEKARQRLSSYSSNNLARTNQLMSPVPLQYSSPQQAQLSGGVPEAHGGIQFMAPSQDRGMNRGGGANGM